MSVCALYMDTKDPQGTTAAERPVLTGGLQRVQSDRAVLLQLKSFRRAATRNDNSIAKPPRRGLAPLNSPVIAS